MVTESVTKKYRELLKSGRSTRRLIGKLRKSGREIRTMQPEDAARHYTAKCIPIAAAFLLVSGNSPKETKPHKMFSIQERHSKQ